MNTLDKASHYAQDTYDKIASAASQTAEVLAEKSEDMLDAEQKLMKKCRRQVRDNPITALGIAAVSGFLLSRLFTGR